MKQLTKQPCILLDQPWLGFGTQWYVIKSVTIYDPQLCLSCACQTQQSVTLPNGFLLSRALQAMWTEQAGNQCRSGLTCNLAVSAAC